MLIFFLHSLSLSLKTNIGKKTETKVFVFGFLVKKELHNNVLQGCCRSSNVATLQLVGAFRPFLHLKVFCQKEEERERAKILPKEEKTVKGS